MMTKTLATTLAALATTLVVSRAQTMQSAATDSPAPQITPIEQTIHDIKNPAPWINWGGDIRVRNEYFNNGLSLSPDPRVDGYFFGPVHEQDYFRFRGRLWTSITPAEGISLNARVAAEPREFMKASTMDTYYNEEGLQWRYGIVDKLNIEWKKPLDLPATLTVGRQDIFLGDGWLVGDGSPEDGSFTMFLDAARLTVDLPDQQTTIDAIGLVQYARADEWMPVLGSPRSPPESVPVSLTDQNEKGAIIWVANKSIPAANVDGYFIYKHDSGVGRDDTRAGYGFFGDAADIFTAGGRVSGVFADHWKYSAEGAYQFGQKQDPFLNMSGNNPLLAPSAQATGFRDISALGVNSKFTYMLKDSLNTQVSVSYEFLSGDDPKTSKDEMFDVLWGRWPSWSEVYNIYSYVQETRVGQTANIHRIGPTLALTPMKDLDFSASYYVLLADQEVPTRSDYLPAAIPPDGGAHPFSNNGIFRGQYLQSVLKYKFSRHLSGHLWSELLFPGDFYVSRNMVSFLRAELMMTF